MRCIHIEELFSKLALLSPINRFRVFKIKRLKDLKLNIGCGKVKLPGWINIDIEPGADVIIDVTKRLPFDNNSVNFIYCEHVLEHFTYEDGKMILKEFERCLKENGVLRVAMPDLDYIILKYNTDWRSQDWLSWLGHEFIKTKGQMINISFRSWGHKYIYNEEDLRNAFVEAGFKKIVRCEANISSYKELSALETRKDSRLIMEAEK